jgi:hypothetical protein
MLFDHDPLSGVTTWFDYDNTNQQSSLTYEQDVTPYLEKAAALRQHPERTKRGIKEDFWHYAIVPVGIQYEMLNKHGVNYWDKNDGAKVLKLLNTEYKRFKVTELEHNIKNGT